MLLAFCSKPYKNIFMLKGFYSQCSIILCAYPPPPQIVSLLTLPCLKQESLTKRRKFPQIQRSTVNKNATFFTLLTLAFTDQPVHCHRSKSALSRSGEISPDFCCFYGGGIRHNEDIMHSFQNFIVRLIPNHPPPLETRIWKLVVRALVKIYI